jgi:hypothetical protein
VLAGTGEQAVQVVVDDGPSLLDRALAIRAPARVASLTLLDPAGLTRPDARFYRWLTITGLAT